MKQEDVYNINLSAFDTTYIIARLDLLNDRA